MRHTVIDQSPLTFYLYACFFRPSLVASNIENFMLLLSSMEHRLETAKTDKSDIADPNDYDRMMNQRIRMAKLEDTYYDDNYDDEEENEGECTIDRRRRFRRAYEVALATDTQGYQVASATGDRTPQELTAISWAAFCTELIPEVDATFRIQALDCDNLFDRLKLASGLMRQKKALLRAKMEKAGLKLGGDFDEADDGGDSTGN
jgi:ribosomal protein S18 acetylase RimI-like enzyme